MRKLKLQMQITADGYVAGPQGQLDWTTWNMDAPLVAFINEPTDSSDNRRWGQGRGSRGGVAHVPAALRGTVRVGKNRRRLLHWSTRLSVRKVSELIRLRAREALLDWARLV
jgi:hypothetical protein